MGAKILKELFLSIIVTSELTVHNQEVDHSSYIRNYG